MFGIIVVFYKDQVTDREAKKTSPPSIIISN